VHVEHHMPHLYQQAYSAHCCDLSVIACRYDPDCPADEVETALQKLGTTWGVTMQIFTFIYIVIFVNYSYRLYIVIYVS
jgi:putative component of membrane protein insertase Oxa1/YidC/SpoIIIJ protein YidD